MTDQNFNAALDKKPWALTGLGLLVIASLLALPAVFGSPGGKDLPDIVRFIGHFHPVILHLPIGVFALIVFQELVAVFGRRGDAARNSSLLPLFFGAASAVVAAIAGFLLYQGHAEEYGGNALAERHLWGGLIFAGAAVATLIVRVWCLRLSASPWFYRLLLFGSVGVMGFASHDGASMTHGSNYLTDYAPAMVRAGLGLGQKADKKELAPKSAAPSSANVDARRVYADIVVPILERRCVQCHKESKAKGDFRMDRYELMVKGGVDGPGIVPGDAENSSIIFRMGLPKIDEDRMPPKGKPEMEDAEIVVLKWWIDQGADPEKAVRDFVVPEEIQRAITRLR